MINSFLTVKTESRAQFKDRNSRFIGLIFPVQSEEEVKIIQQQLRKEFYDARHHCYAYILGFEKDRYRANDDGEPSGSAGKPIYNQLLSAGITNVLCVVVRYFGGTKLGVPGLINAYKIAARLAIEDAGIIECFIAKKLSLKFPYEKINTAMQLADSNSVKIISQDFDMNCKMELHVKIDELELAVKKLSSAGIDVIEGEEFVIY